MSEHIDRMKKEHRELKEKVDALGAFVMTNDIFKTLPSDEQLRMSQQLGFMQSYLSTLDARLWCAHGNKK